jgi:hypothetical protein
MERVSFMTGTCGIINHMNISNRRGDLPNLTRKEFADLFLKYADQAMGMKDRESLVVEFPDGRILTFRHLLFGKKSEWSVSLFTLKQRTAKCIRRWYERQAWLYLAPYNEEHGYTTDPTKKWSYRVWA